MPHKKARVALSYIDCDGDFTIRNGRPGLTLGARFVADTVLGAIYVGTVHVWGGEDKRYKLLLSDDLIERDNGSDKRRSDPR